MGYFLGWGCHWAPEVTSQKEFYSNSIQSGGSRPLLERFSFTALHENQSCPKALYHILRAAELSLKMWLFTNEMVWSDDKSNIFTMDCSHTQNNTCVAEIKRVSLNKLGWEDYIQEANDQSPSFLP